MKMTTKLLFALALVAVLSLMAGCSTSYRVLSVDDHPSGEVTLMKTLTTHHRLAGTWNQAQYNFWECQRTSAGLSCEKTCWNYNSSGQWPENAPKDGAQCLPFNSAAY